MKLKATFLLISIICCLSCKNDAVQTVRIEGKYSIELPSWLSRTNHLNEEASLQYQNTSREFYVIIIDEPKDAVEQALEENLLSHSYAANLEGYSKLITDGMDSSISIDSLPKFKDIKINGLKARILAFEGLSSGHKIYWKLVFIEGKNTYYQVMVWTLAGNRGKYDKEMQAIINSFKERDKSRKR